MQNSTGGADVTKAPLVRAIAAFGLPLVVAMALAAVFNLVDFWIVARPENSRETAQVAVAAVTIASLVNTIPMIIFNGIVNAMIALVARHHGLGNRRRANVAAGQGFLITCILGVAFGLPPWIFAEEIVIALGATGDVIGPATDYLAIMSAGTITMFLLLQLTGAMRAAGNSVLPMVLLIGANVLNLLLNIWLVMGPPQLGVAGAAWGTVVARGAAVVIAIVVLYRGFAGLRLRRFVWNWKTSWTILEIGIPSCGQWLVRMLSYLYLLRFVSTAAVKAGEGITEAQAAFGIGLRLDTLALFSGFAWGAAAATFVGQNLGAGRPDRARRATWIALGLNMMMMLGFAATYVLLADPLIALLGFDVTTAGGADIEAVRAIGRTYLFVASAGYVFLAVAVTISQGLAGAGATRFPFFLEVVAFGVIGYPLTAWMAENADRWGLRGLWVAAIGLHLAVAVVYVLWFRHGPWAEKELK